MNDHDSNATGNSSGFSDSFFSSFLTTSTPNRQSSKNTATTPSPSGKLKPGSKVDDETTDQKSHSSKLKNKTRIDTSNVVSETNSDVEDGGEDDGSNESTTYFTPVSIKTEKKRANNQSNLSFKTDIDNEEINPAPVEDPSKKNIVGDTDNSLQSVDSEVPFNTEQVDGLSKSDRAAINDIPRSMLKLLILEEFLKVKMLEIP